MEESIYEFIDNCARNKKVNYLVVDGFLKACFSDEDYELTFLYGIPLEPLDGYSIIVKMKNQSCFIDLNSLEQFVRLSVDGHGYKLEEISENNRIAISIFIDFFTHFKQVAIQKMLEPFPKKFDTHFPEILLEPIKSIED